MNQIQSSVEILKNDYADLRAKGYWFAAKRFGWGWVPITWQGWLATLIFIFQIIGDVVAAVSYEQVSLSAYETFIFFIPSFMLHVTMFFLITYGKGERPTWNWGIKRTHEDRVN